VTTVSTAMSAGAVAGTMSSASRTTLPAATTTRYTEGPSEMAMQEWREVAEAKGTG
jgi:hypothetical protein